MFSSEAGVQLVQICCYQPHHRNQNHCLEIGSLLASCTGFGLVSCQKNPEFSWLDAVFKLLQHLHVKSKIKNFPLRLRA